MSRRPSRHPSRRRGDARLLIASALLIAAGGLASVVEALVLGHVTPPVLALDVVGVAHFPFGLLALRIPSHPAAAGRPRHGALEDEDDGGWGFGGGDDIVEPVEPRGGLVIDWPQFEADFRAYAETVSLTAAA